MMRLRLSVFVVAAAVAMSAASAAPAVAYSVTAPTRALEMCCGGRTHLEAVLRGSSAYPDARGHAHYDSGMMAGRHFDMDLWNVGPLAGRTLVVTAGGHRLGNVHVGSGGRCHFDRSGRGMPRLTSGAAVRVRTSGGKLVVSGTLRRHH